MDRETRDELSRRDRAGCVFAQSTRGRVRMIWGVLLGAGSILAASSGGVWVASGIRAKMTAKRVEKLDGHFTRLEARFHPTEAEFRAVQLVGGENRKEWSAIAQRLAAQEALMARQEILLQRIDEKVDEIRPITLSPP